MPIFSTDLLPKLHANDPTVTELICSQAKGVNLTSQEVEDIATALQNNTKVEIISFLGNPINANAARLLAQFFMVNTGLKQAYLGTCDLRSNVSIILPPLETHPSLVLLDLNTNSLGDEDGLHIVSLLKKNTVLEELEVGNNNLTRESYQIMRNALEDNPELAAKLDFCSTPEQYFDSPEKDVIAEIRTFCETKKMGIGCKM